MRTLDNRGIVPMGIGGKIRLINIISAQPAAWQRCIS